jgi:hypothetical protein
MIISLSGKALVGKDSLANTLVLEYGFYKLSFAQNLKRMCQWVFGLSVYQTDSQEGKQTQLAEPTMFSTSHFMDIMAWMKQTHNLSDEYAQIAIMDIQNRHINKREFTTPRDILQFVGTDVCRNICQSYHVDIVEKILSENSGYNFVSVDSRFPNERAMLKKHGARLILINRPNVEFTSNHASETSLDDNYDLIINNNASLKELAAMARYSIKPLILVGEINGDEILKYPRRNKIRN